MINLVLLKKNFLIGIKHWLLESGLNEKVTEYLFITIIIVILAVACILANYITKKILLTILNQFVKKSKTQWDDMLLKRKVFSTIANFAPAVVIYYSIDYILVGRDGWIAFLQSATYIYMIVIALLTLMAFLNAVNDIYNTLPQSEYRSIKGYMQVVKIILSFIGGILILSIILDKSPGYFLTGLGAVAAILMLIFKDTILGLVGGIQMAANDMVRPGDWVSMPSKNADGIVIDITLHTVKVQNWDKTITTIPTYSMVSESFSNWRGMQESGGRRMMRSINIDISSIKFCTPEMLEKYKKIKHLNKYITDKQKEIQEYNEKNNIPEDDRVTKRNFTNIGVFRKYLEEYLNNNEKVNHDHIMLVRQLEATEKGLPIQIYAFSKIQAWAQYESVQADIFDHIFAILKEFELKAYQLPTGDDVKELGKG